MLNKGLIVCVLLFVVVGCQLPVKPNEGLEGELDKPEREAQQLRTSEMPLVKPGKKFIKPGKKLRMSQRQAMVFDQSSIVPKQELTNQVLRQSAQKLIEPTVSLRKKEDKYTLLYDLSIQTGLEFDVEMNNKAQMVLEHNFTNQSSKWHRITSGDLIITPVRIFKSENGLFCRDYQTSLISKMREVTVKSVACRDSDGVWFSREQD